MRAWRLLVPKLAPFVAKRLHVRAAAREELQAKRQQQQLLQQQLSNGETDLSAAQEWHGSADQQGLCGDVQAGSGGGTGGPVGEGREEGEDEPLPSEGGDEIEKDTVTPFIAHIERVMNPGPTTAEAHVQQDLQRLSKRRHHNEEAHQEQGSSQIDTLLQCGQQQEQPWMWLRRYSQCVFNVCGCALGGEWGSRFKVRSCAETKVAKVLSAAPWHASPYGCAWMQQRKMSAPFCIVISNCFLGSEGCIRLAEKMKKQT